MFHIAEAQQMCLILHISTFNLRFKIQTITHRHIGTPRKLVRNLSHNLDSILALHIQFHISMAIRNYRSIRRKYLIMYASLLGIERLGFNHKTEFYIGVLLRQIDTCIMHNIAHSHDRLRHNIHLAYTRFLICHKALQSTAPMTLQQSDLNSIHILLRSLCCIKFSRGKGVRCISQLLAINHHLVCSRCLVNANNSLTV